MQLLTCIHANVVSRFCESKKSSDPEVTSEHQDHHCAALDDVPNAADYLYVAPLLAILLDSIQCCDCSLQQTHKASHRPGRIDGVPLLSNSS